MIGFIIGLVVGSWIGVALMCVLQAGHDRNE